MWSSHPQEEWVLVTSCPEKHKVGYTPIVCVLTKPVSLDADVMPSFDFLIEVVSAEIPKSSNTRS